MLLKRTEQDDKINSIYTSSNICASVYDKTNQTLTITFNHGGQYIYESVNLAEYTRFELADSQGAVLNSHIKLKSVKKLGQVDVKDILVEVNTIKTQEDKAKLDHATKVMVDAMNAIVSFHTTTGSVDTKLYKKAKEAIAAYDNVIQPKLDKVNG
jgi:KTSC domain